MKITTLIRDTSGQDVAAAAGPAPRRRRWLGLAAGLVLIAGLFSFLLRGWAETAQVVPRERLRVVTVTEGPFVRDAAAQGIVVAAVSPTLFATAPGTVQYQVQPGEVVTAGQLLAVLASPQLENERGREAATLGSIEAALARQAIEVRRQALLSRERALAADRRLRAAELELRSPIAGTVADLAAAQGASVTQEAPLVTDELMEAELFGTESGAFTGVRARAGRFEAADGGTLFLDELGNLSLQGQARLLRVLQTGEFERLGSSQTRRTRVRVIAATNAKLPEMIRAGRFREDLFYRLNVIELEVPPLATRQDDILPLAGRFLQPGFTLAADAAQALLRHAWPGNVRELCNVVQRACLLAPDSVITTRELGLPAATDALVFVQAFPGWTGRTPGDAADQHLVGRAAGPALEPGRHGGDRRHHEPP